MCKLSGRYFRGLRFPRANEQWRPRERLDSRRLLTDAHVAVNVEREIDIAVPGDGLVHLR